MRNNRRVYAEDVFSRLKSNSRYAALCDDVLQRTAKWAAARGSSVKHAVKRAKQKLHQIHGSYWDGTVYDGLRKCTNALARQSTSEQIQNVCRHMLHLHRSTRERVPHMNALYPLLMKEIGPVRSVLDLACGLHPFALPWMDLTPETTYIAVDIDCPLMDGISGFFSRLDALHPSLAAHAAVETMCADILSFSLPHPVDVVFLLKTLPCLERQEKGAGFRILQQLSPRAAVISFPRYSFGGHHRGMEQHYHSFLSTIIDRLPVTVQKIVCGNEIYYILTSREHGFPTGQRTD